MVSLEDANLTSIALELKTLNSALYRKFNFSLRVYKDSIQIEVKLCRSPHIFALESGGWNAGTFPPEIGKMQRKISKIRRKFGKIS